MPRQAHGRPVSLNGTPRPVKRKSTKAQYHNALEIAEKQSPLRAKVKQHRLGHLEEDSDLEQSPLDNVDRTSKRRRLDSDDEVVRGSESDEHPWHMGIEEGDEDSDIDSDGAFGQSDEERFAGYTFRGSTTEQSRRLKTSARSQKRRDVREIELSEGEGRAEFDGSGVVVGEDGTELGDGAVDLATALDLNEDVDRKERHQQQRRNRKQATDVAFLSDDELSGPSDGQSEGFTDEDEGSQLSFSGDEDTGGFSKLRNFVEGLGAEARATGSSKCEPSGTLEPDLTSSKLTAADLLPYVKDPGQRQSLKILHSSEKRGPEKYQGGIPGKLEPPLAKRLQDRLDRVAAYDKSRETLDRWIETVKQNRRAEHISFPLQDPRASSASNVTHLTPTSQSRPVTSLELTIQEIMQESGVASKNGLSTDEKEQAFEELQERKIPIEEVQARRAELRMARDLMFREEIRARRIKKIKSKAYRRIHRKERDKAALEEKSYLAAAGLLDSDEERERHERRRAEERMGERHRESRWAKSVKSIGQAAWDEDTRHAVSDLARRDDTLRRRVEGKLVRDLDQSDPESTSGSDDESSSVDEGFNGFDETLDRLEHGPISEGASRLGSMAFMRKAEASRKAANDAEIREVRRQIRGDGDAEEKEGLENTGRWRFGRHEEVKTAIFRPANEKNEFEAILSEDEEPEGRPVAQQPTDLVRGITHENNRPLSQAGKGDSAESKAPHQTKEKQKSTQQLKQQHEGTSSAEIVLDDFTSHSGFESDDSTPLDLSDNAALAKSLFAGDDVIRQEFDKEKKDAVADEGDQVIDDTLPGWGSWTGAGVSKREQRRGKGRFVTTINGVSEEQRKDAKLERVIINEKRVKKNVKYLASELPHPFESKQQYERSLRLPIGPEWTTKTSFQDATRPRVLLKQGIIRPMLRPLT